MKSNIYIILLNYNGYKDTIECIDSIKNNIKNTKFKIIVVDNKSTDDSVKKIEENINEDIILIRSSVNNGFSAGNNIGIKYAIEHDADYVLLLNNDTIVEEDFLTPIVEFAEKNSQCGCISSRIYYNLERNKIWYDGGKFNFNICRAEHYRFNETNSNISGINETGFISGCCMLIPVQVIKKVGLMDERYFLYVEDTEYSLRIKKYGYKLYWDSDHSIFHKVSSSTNKISKMAQFYEIRNRLLLRDTYLNICQKITSMLYNIIFYSYKVATRKFRLKILIKAQLYNKKKMYGKIEKI